jgi:hypothetical protein
MARELNVAWDFLTAVAHGRQRLAAARPLIWDKARLPTALRIALIAAPLAGDPGQTSASTETDEIAVRVTLETHLKDGRRLVSCLDVIARPRRWLVHPYINLVDGAEHSVWQGQSVERDDSAGFADLVDSAAIRLVEATTGLDFAELERG